MLEILEDAAQGAMQNILTVSYEQLVSSDVIGRNQSCIVDAEFSTVNEDMIKLLIWHDNEHGYSSRILEIVCHVTNKTA